MMNFNEARVIGEHKGVYRVKSANGEFLAKVTGKHMFLAEKREDYPAVGDRVTIDEHADGKATIRSILPRTTILKKKYSNKQDEQVIAANIDVAFVIEAVDRDYNLNRLERFLVLGREGNIRPAIVLNKIDLITEEELAAKKEQLKERFPDVDVLLTSTITRQGIGELVDYMQEGKTYCFLGSSGVGKSTLINYLLGKEEIRTGGLSDSTGKGKHTTTARGMYYLENGAMVVDNPGTREVGMTSVSAGLKDVFDDIVALSVRCKYADCTHANERGCAVRKAMETGKLDEAKYSNYIKLKSEAEHYEMTELERREKDRTFGKFIKRAKKEIKTYKP